MAGNTVGEWARLDRKLRKANIEAKRLRGELKAANGISLKAIEEGKVKS